MQTVILNEYRKNCINYIQPVKQLAENIYDHRISYQDFISLKQKFQSNHHQVYSYIITRYYSQDVILLQNMKNTQYCFMHPIQYLYDDGNLRFVRKINIPLSVTRFNPSYEYDHIDQVLIIGLSLDCIDIQFELIYKQIMKFTDRNTNDYTNPDLFKSFSYKMYITNDQEIQKYLEMLI